MADLTSKEIAALIERVTGYSPSEAAKKQLTEAILGAQDRAAEADELRRQLKSAIKKSVAAEVEVAELSARLEMQQTGPVIIVPHGEWIVGPRDELNVEMIGKGWPVIFTDDPKPPSAKGDAQ